MSISRRIVRRPVHRVVRDVEGGEEADPGVTIAVELQADDGAYLLADDGITQLTAD
jgi:hypothetical protein